VQVRAVEPGDWPAFGNAVTSARTGNPAGLPGRVVLTDTLGVKGRPDELTETDIDLAVDPREGYRNILRPLASTHRRFK
jgi:hypothetical protein